MSGLRGFALVAGVSLSQAMPAAAQSEFPEGAVVKVFASATLPDGGSDCREGLGVIVSESGLVLTVYGVIGALGAPADGEADRQAREAPQVKFEQMPLSDVSIAVKSAAQAGNEDCEAASEAGLPTWPVYVEEFVNLLLLKVGQLPEGFQTQAELMGSLQSVEVGDLLRRVGEGDVRSTHEVRSLQGVRNSWTVDGAGLGDAQRGTPFFNAEARLVGLLIGDGPPDGERNIVPAGYADAMVVGQRFRQIQRRMQEQYEARFADFEPLRRDFEWTATANDEELVLTFTRKVLGDPRPSKLAFTVSPVCEKDARQDRLADLPSAPVEAAVDDPRQAKGVFVWGKDFRGFETAMGEHFECERIDYVVNIDRLWVKSGAGELASEAELAGYAVDPVTVRRRRSGDGDS